VSQNPWQAWFSVAMSDPNNPPPGNPYGDPPPSNPYGQAPPPQPPAYGQPAQPYPPASYGTTDPDKRPGTVTAASIITIVFSAITALAFGIFAIVLVAARDDVTDEVNREIEGQPGFEDINADDLMNVITVFLVIFAIWSLIALVTAVLAMKRQNWARIVTVISAVVSGLFSLLGITSGLSAITLLAAIAVVVLYFTGGANEWYRRKNAQPQLPVGTTQPWG
jgi:preprotein translocase subunit SecG